MKTLRLISLAALALLHLCCVKSHVMEPAEDSGKSLKTGAATPNAAATPGDLADGNIKYFGRWDFTNPAEYASYWGGAYIRVNFTGTTVKIKVGYPTHYFAKIDNGPWVSYYNANGTINLTPTPLASGTHTLSVAQGKDYDYQFKFQGLILDAGAVTSPPSVFSQLIEWIGDSITAGYTDEQANVSGYPWVCSETLLHTEHTQIAYPGVRLVTSGNGPGMDVQYFKLQNPAYTTAPAWDFTRYTPKVIVINLGTNDNGHVPDDQFRDTYISFLANIRAKFPNVEIFVVRTFINVMTNPTIAAVNARIAAGDTKVHYIDTNGWLTNADYTDGLHPSVAGNIKAAGLLQPIIAPYLDATPSQQLAAGTYKIINRNSGLSLDAKDLLTANNTPLQQWSYGGGANQQWRVTLLGNGRYKITGVQSGRSLQVKDNSTSDGAGIVLFDYTNQSWTVTPTTNGYYTIQSAANNKFVEVAGGSTANGALVQQWAPTNAANQQWAFQAP